MLRIYTEEQGEAVLFARMLLLTLRREGPRYELQGAMLGGDPKDAVLRLLDIDALRKEQITQLLSAGPCVLYTAKQESALQYPDTEVFIRPFSMEQFCTRLRQICLQYRQQDPQASVFAGQEALSVHPVRTAAEELVFGSHGVFFRQQPLHLTAKETEVLQYLYRRRGQTCTREEILTDLWGYPGGEASTNVVDVYIRYLRKKIDQTFDVRLLRSVRGKGYTIL